MITSEMKREIQREIERQINVVLNAQTGPTTSMTETIQALFPGMPGINARPVVHPAGFVSRAVQGTISVVAKVGAGIQNRMVIGHRDKARPTDLSEGETTIYSQGDFRVKVENGQILVGKGEDYEPVVVGETLRQLLIAIIDLIIAHQHIGNLGFQTSAPTNASDFLAQRQQNLDNEKILAKNGGRYD